MKTKLLYFILSMFFLAEQSTFGAKITIFNHAGVSISTSMPSIKEIASEGKISEREVPDTSFNITFPKDNPNYECKNIPIEDKRTYTVNKINNDFNVNSDKPINGKNQWTCIKLLPTFTVKNNTDISISAWLGKDKLGKDKFEQIRPGQTSNKLQSVDTNRQSLFGITIDANNNQKINCDDIRIENDKQYIISNNNGVITVNNQKNSCYLIGKVTVTNNTEGILSIGSTQVGGKNNKTVFEMGEDRKSFDATITYNFQKYELKNIPALLGVTEYTIQEENNNYVVKAGNNILQSVQKKK